MWDDAITLYPAGLVIDLSDRPRVDAAAIVVLLQVHRRLIWDDAHLVPRHPAPRVGRMLSLAHLDRVFTIEPAGRDQPRAGALR